MSTLSSIAMKEISNGAYPVGTNMISMSGIEYLILLKQKIVFVHAYI